MPDEGSSKPWANRYNLPFHIYRVIRRRNHNFEFPLRYRLDRVAYGSPLRNDIRGHRISPFDFRITCNHIQLRRIGDLSRSMQRQQGESAGSF